jgi:hypothetical protein
MLADFGESEGARRGLAICIGSILDPILGIDLGLVTKSVGLPSMTFSHNHR